MPATDFTYPYLNVDLDQATMVVVSAAQQSQFMEQISQSIGFWGGLAEACALIGFTVAVLGGVLRKINVFAILCWLLVMVILFVAPINAAKDGARNSDPLFFTSITPQKYKWAQQPYQTFHAEDVKVTADDEGTPPPPPEPKTPMDDLEKLDPVKKGKPFYMFTPQLVMIDVLNRIRTAVSDSFVDDNAYVAPVVTFSMLNSESLKPLANFSRVMFGNIDDGTYSALLPMLLSFIMVVMIVCTPFILIMAAMLPHWAPSLLLLTVAGVAYTKVVEIMFALVRGVFGLFLDIEGKAAVGAANVAVFNEVLLGLGYLCALAASVWLVLKVRKTGQSAHNMLQDFIRESRSASVAQRQAAERMSQSSAALQSASAAGGVGAAASLSAPLHQLPFDADRHEALRARPTRQKPAEEQRVEETSASGAQLTQEKIERAYAKTREQALKQAQEAGVPSAASAPRMFSKNGQKAQTVEPALSKVANTLGGDSPEELHQSYDVATQLFTTGALTMRTDEHNQMRIEVNLTLKVMQTLSPELQDAVKHLQNSGNIIKTADSENQPFFALAE